jgi:hypothetical protein
MVFAIMTSKPIKKIVHMKSSYISNKKKELVVCATFESKTIKKKI